MSFNYKLKNKKIVTLLRVNYNNNDAGHDYGAPILCKKKQFFQTGSRECKL